MDLPQNTLVAVADGEHFTMFRSGGSSHLEPLGHPSVSSNNHSAGSRHHSSASNPDEKQDSEDMHAVATAEYLNRGAMANEFAHAVVIAAPKTLGELRKHYHKTFQDKLLTEIAKDMTGQTRDTIAAAIAAA